ncbi:hypothetical protein [Thermosipho atlanticus]|uniref:Septum formation initiator n=1 Tax=Thermosipho atlanticus DSM 15807 TaxID=1123380 RepID=A0A1M5R4Q0_9BACT|nr:hypothetical protein [Thermosipho atlanticus]SHH21374.1 hypothetical protein SAMN02745199_0338 [Thermosipho atlanticus DSM 15807]
MKTYKKKKISAFLYSLIIVVLSLFLFVTLISSIIRYNVNLKEVNRLEKEYNTLKFEYDKKLELYNTLKNIDKGSDKE